MRVATQLVQIVAGNQRLLKTLFLIAVGIGVLLLGSHLIVYADDKRTIAIGMAVLVLPLVLYAALAKPILFPLGLFVILVPFDDLLRIDPRFGTFTKLTALCAGAALLLWLLQHRRFAKLSKGTFLWLALLVWMSISIFWAIDAQEAITKLGTYVLLATLYLVISLMPINEMDYNKLLIAVVLGGVAASVYAVYLFHTGAFVQNQQFQGVASSRLLVEYDGNKLGPDEFSAALLLPIAIILTWALRRSWSPTKLGLGAIFLLMVAAIYVSASRGALLALGVLIGYMILRGRFKTQLIALSLMALGASFLSRTSPWARFSSAISTGGAGRVSIWKVGLAALKHNWLVGTGVGNFPTAYDRSFITVYQSYYARWHRAPHDMLIEFSVELGVIGLILLLTAWYVQMRSLWMIGPSSSLFDMRIALEGVVLASLVAGLFVGTMTGKYTWLLFEVMALTRTVAFLTAPARIPPLLSGPRTSLAFQHIEERVPKEPVHA